MDKPVRLHWIALILNLWLVIATNTQALVPLNSTRLIRAERELQSPGKGQRHPSQEAVHETSTLSLFHLSKASKCCQLTIDLQCKLNCTQGLSKLKAFEAKCAKLQEAHEACAQERELMSQKKQIIAHLEGECGVPLTVASNDQLWMCLLQSGYFDQVEEQSTTNKNEDSHTESQSETDQQQRPRHKAKKYKSSLQNESMNPVKWICCERGHSETCRQLCYSTLSNDWTDNWRHFSQFCFNSPAEMALRQCLDDAEAVCAFGCRSNLKFCHYFNNPNGRRGLVNFFRDCNVEADQAARNTYHSWLEQDVIQYSHRLALHFKNLTNCQPDLWKILACTLHLKPCLPERHRTEICRSNCKHLVDECIDLEQTNSQFDSGTLCDIITNQLTNLSFTYSASSAVAISPNTDAGCIDISLFENQTAAPLRVSGQMSGATSTSSEPELIYSACRTNKCRKDQLCLRNQDCSKDNCPVYRCVNVCTVGKLNEFKVPQDTFVTIPVMDARNVQVDLDESNHRDSCYNLCFCNTDGELVNCKFFCVNRSREEMVANAEKAALDQIECMSTCPFEYKPICENHTSQNYFNACTRDCVITQRQSRIASNPHNFTGSYWHNNCGRVTDLQREAKLICLKTDEIDEKCTLDPGAQLVPLNGDQFQIIRKVMNLRYPGDIQKLALDDETVCDSHGEGHANLRSFHQLANDNVFFSYFGDCLNYCSLFSPVCGRDGVDYQSECVAHSRHVLVDNFGGCHSRNPLICPEMRCPSRKFVHYLSLNRCPFCGSVAYFHYESDYFQYITSQADGHDIKQSLVHRGKLTVQALSQQLRDLVSVNTCDLYLHQLAENFVVALMRSKFNENQQVAMHQQTICQLELKRIVTLVKNQSPVLQLLFPLSLLRYNETIAIKMASLSLQEKNASSSLHVSLSLQQIIAFIIIQKYVLYLAQIKLTS